MTKQSGREERIEKRVLWKRHIEEWSRSGSSQAGYCRQHKLSIKLFTYWKRRLWQKSSVSFVPVQVKRETPIVANRSPELVLHKYGYRIEIKEGFNPAALADVLRTISEIKC